MRDTDGDRLCWGTLTRLPVRPPDIVDQHSAASAMTSAPIVGAALGVVAGALAWGVWLVRPDAFGALLASAIALGFTAWATRAIHLDGLADTADALGSGRPAAQALDIARKSDIGPFGVICVVFVLAIDVFALAANVSDAHAMLATTVAFIAGRLALPLGCMRGVRAARSDGLGAAVAGSVHPGAVAAVVIGWTAVVCIAAAAIGGDDAAHLALSCLAAVVGALLAAGLVLLIARRRLNGITGDVLGAMVEISTMVALVILALT